MSRRVVPAKAQEGMVLEEPILDRNGRIILKAGTVLTQGHIARLGQWGVSQISVKESEGTKGGTTTIQIDAKVLKEIEAKIDERFAACASPTGAVLRKLARTYAEELLKKNIKNIALFGEEMYQR